MNEQEIRNLQQEVAATKRTLSLIQAIDEIRDGSPEPLAMLSSIAKLITDELNADLCLLMLRHRETNEIELKAVHQKRKVQFDVEAFASPDLIQEVSQVTVVSRWAPSTAHKLSNSSIVVAPIIMGHDKRLGSLLLLRTASPFTDEEVTLLDVAEDHIDSAIVQGYSHHDLLHYVNEIETIYQIDHIRDQGLGFDDMLTAVVSKLENLLDAEAGFVMLYDYTGENLEMRAVSHENMFQPAQQLQMLQEVADESLKSGNLICHNDFTPPIKSIMCLPLILNERIIGVLGVVNRRGAGCFYKSDQRLLSAIGSQMDTAIFESLEQKRLRRVLGRSVDPQIMESILSNPGVDFLEGERRFLTVLYADVRGSTNLAEKTSPEQLVSFINMYLSEMTNVILEYKGTLDKFVGDEVMALFGAPFAQEDHALRAVQAGLAMQAAHEKILEKWTAQGGLVAPIGVGIATGDAIVGEMGSAQRSDYTAIGRVANLGARICSAAQGGQVLVSPSTYELVKDHVVAEPIHGMSFKGMGDLMTVYDIQRLL